MDNSIGREVDRRHRGLLAELGLPTSTVDPLLRDMRDLLRGMELVGEASPRATDVLLSFGERCSARVVAAFLQQQGLNAFALDSWDAGLLTDSRYGRAEPEEDGGQRIRESMQATPFADGAVPVLTGFIAKDRDGNITTLGRNGSDYSAALFGAALGAEEIQIWTDVDGVMTADPRVCPEAQLIERMSFGEASELAHYGGKVLHPAAIQPAMTSEIPVRVLNTSRPESPGTRIVRGEPGVPEAPVRGIVHKGGVHLVTVSSTRMLKQSGFLGDVFGHAARWEIDVDLLATSEVSVSMTIDQTDSLASFVGALETLGSVEVQLGKAVVCVAGRDIGNDPRHLARVMTVLADRGVAVSMVSVGALRRNIALVIDEASSALAVGALHDAFFPRGR